MQEQSQKIEKNNILLDSSSHSSMATAPLLVKYFELYYDFFIFDIETSILLGKNYELTELFRVNLANLLNYKDGDEIYINDFLKDLELIINETKNIYTSKKDTNFSKIKFDSRDIFKINNMIDNKILFVVKKTVKIILLEFKEFFISYENLHSHYESDYEIFKDLLIEFNNTLSHILLAIINCYDNSSNIKEIDSNIDMKNIERAKSHLHRGALDGYKEIVILNRDIVMNNRNIFNSYITIREIEALKIGESEIKKNNIVEQYKALSSDILHNKLQSQKP